MASSTEPTDIPIPQMDVETATDILTQGVAMLQWQRQEIERLKGELANRDAAIARLKHQLAIIRRHP